MQITSVADLKKDLKAKHLRGLAIDIDETLSFTLKYWIAEMMRLFGNPENLSADEIIAKYRYANLVPYWQTPEVKEWMIKQVYSNELQTQLEVIAEADKYVHELVKSAPIVVYLTIRPEEVIPGTQIWLDKHGFPKAPIIARPTTINHWDGNAWKAEVLNELYPEVAGLIDDNYEVIHYLPDDYLGKFFLFAMSEFKDEKHQVYCCPTWSDVVTQVKNNF